MKIKILMVLSLATVIFFAGCKSDTNINTVNTNVNAIVKPTEAAKTEPMMKEPIEEALKAKGFNDITVDTSGPKVIIRGTVEKDKLPEVIEIVNKASGGKPVDNQVTGK